MNEQLKQIVISTEKKKPLITMLDTSPVLIKRYLNDSADIVRNVTKTKAAFDKLHKLIDALYDFYAKDQTVISVEELVPVLKISKSTILRTLKICSDLEVMQSNSFRDGKVTYSCYSTRIPTITRATEFTKRSELKTKVKQPELTKPLGGDTLSWAENYSISSQRHLLYGKNLVSILIKLFKHKPDPNKKELQSLVFLNGISIPAELSCNVNTTLPESNDALYYLAILECVKRSLRENVSRAGKITGDILKSSQYQVPVNSIVEQLGKEANGQSRSKCVEALKRLDGAKITLNELPDSDLYDNTESFFSFQPLSNLSVFLAKTIDGKKVTGKGQSIAIFALPDFIIESIIQSIKSNLDTELFLNNISHSVQAQPQSNALIEELLDLPSDWVKGKLDVLTEALMIAKANQSQTISWVELFREIKQYRTPRTLKVTVMKKVQSRGGRIQGAVGTLRYMNWIAKFNDDGIQILQSCEVKPES